LNVEGDRESSIGEGDPLSLPKDPLIPPPLLPPAVPAPADPPAAVPAPPEPAPSPRPVGEVSYDFSLLSQEDLHLFNEGSHFQLYDRLGSHRVREPEGTYFAVWAPNAESVSVMGTWNDWQAGKHPLRLRDQSGIWEGFIPGLGEGELYKYRITSVFHNYQVDKADPFGLMFEMPPKTASVVRNVSYPWKDGAWMARRRSANAMRSPISIYEVHLGSWRRVPAEGHRMLTYRELAPLLGDYLTEMGYTHVEFLPVMEHPFYGSWGYQTTGYFAATRRYGTPEDLMYLIDYLHDRGIGVILDWVPSHFPSDAHGLKYFDGSHLFEHADPRKGYHPDWGSAIFNYGRHEVQSFLISSALFWIDRYHADGLRVDAVASMLYLDFSRKPGEWMPNERGGRENLQAVRFLRRMNEEIHARFPEVLVFAEESGSWPGVSRSVVHGGLGFDQKWDLGWMHDTLDYLKRDPVHRRHYQDRLTFRMMYAWTENFLLPLSHDEVVHGKGSLVGKMPGDLWQRFANLRLLLGALYTQPGKKLLFMGGEFGQWAEWNHETSLDWHLLDQPAHQGMQRLVRDLNRLHREEPALHEGDFDPGGFEWVDFRDRNQSTLSYIRRSQSAEEPVLAVFNFTPVPRHHYRVGVPWGGFWKELLSSDHKAYGGSGLGNEPGRMAEVIPYHGRTHSLSLLLPPLGFILLKPGAKPA
jgi:1,4-alpha-glucan branching enzyme